MNKKLDEIKADLLHWAGPQGWDFSQEAMPRLHEIIDKIEQLESERNLAQIREHVRGSGFQWELTNLPFTDEEKEVIVEYLAWKLYSLLRAVGMPNGGWKGYDPLKIEGNVALSYVFELEDGGRRHAFRDLSHLEHMLMAECATEIQDFFRGEASEQ